MKKSLNRYLPLYSVRHLPTGWAVKTSPLKWVSETGKVHLYYPEDVVAFSGGASTRLVRAVNKPSNKGGVNYGADVILIGSSVVFKKFEAGDFAPVILEVQ